MTEQEQQVEWRDATMQIKYDNRGKPTLKEVKGKILVGSGLGYWIGEDQNMPTFYLPTHINSGHKASPDPLYCEDICKQYLEAIAILADWNKPLEELTSDEQVMKQASNIFFDLWLEDAAATAGGGRW